MKWSVIDRKLARVERELDKAIANAEIPGAVVLARMPRDGELIERDWVRGLALARPERIAMRRDTIFDLASLTKPIATTTAMMLLVEEGAVALDDPVAKWLPDFATRDKEEVTLRHLLTHSSGLKPWRGFHEVLIERERKTGERLLATPEGREMVLERIVRSGLVHETGEAAVYGDLDFIVLGAVVEAVAMQSFEQFCEERIFEPLGLTDTGFYHTPPDPTPDLEGKVHRLPEHARVPSPEERRRIAGTENCPWRERVCWGEVHDPNASAMGGVAGHAGLFSTADDVMRFAQTIVDVWHGRSDKLPVAQVRAFAERQRMPEESDWALGWDTPTLGMSSSGQHFSPHSIGHLGFTGTSLWIDLEKEAIVVMLTNRIHLVAKRSKFTLRPRVHDAILEAFQAG